MVGVSGMDEVDTLESLISFGAIGTGVCVGTVVGVSSRFLSLHPERNSKERIRNKADEKSEKVFMAVSFLGIIVACSLYKEHEEILKKLKIISKEH
jgi:hypothetical protein